MLNTEHNNLYNISKAITSYNRYGHNIPIYLNKCESVLTKDRVATSFISDNILKDGTDFHNTVIRAVDNDRNGIEALLTSDMALNYESLISIIYQLRLEGFTVTDISNISLDEGNQITSVSDLHTDTNIIKVSVRDELRGLVRTLVSDHEYRNKERHISKVVKVSALNKRNYTERMIQIAIKKTFNPVAEFTVRSNISNDRYKVYEGANIISITHLNSITFVSLQKTINIGEFIINLNSLLSRENRPYSINESTEIVMI